MLRWFDAREATDIGRKLAEDFALQPPLALAGYPRSADGGAPVALTKTFLGRVYRDARLRQLNLYQRARLASAFKFRLRNRGIRGEQASRLTRMLMLYLSFGHTSKERAAAKRQVRPHDADLIRCRELSAAGATLVARGAFARAVGVFREIVGLDPANPDAHNNLGAALIRLNRIRDAEVAFRAALGIDRDHADALVNLGNLLRCRGQLSESVHALECAIDVRPTHAESFAGCGMSLLLLARPAEAKVRFTKALALDAQCANALLGLGSVAAFGGAFDRAEEFYQRALRIVPELPAAWAALAGVRQLTAADAGWLKKARKLAASGLAPFEEAALRFAIGKYFDDTRDFERAFRSYKRANELWKQAADPYDRAARERFVADLIAVYSPAAVARLPQPSGASAKPVLVVGMMRSGTSLVEQIISSHPSAAGAGELSFWSDVAREHEEPLRQQLLPESLRRKLRERYSKLIDSHSVTARRVVDKAPVNSDFLGLIYSVLPDVRIIYLQRDPRDACLSSYFQQLSPSLSYATDLADLAHYYRQHARLMAHWRRVLPARNLLEVPYAGLVEDQQTWTRKILDFVGLEWSHECINFHETSRFVMTASNWQVKQKLYRGSVERWRNYEPFIGPLLQL